MTTTDCDLVAVDVPMSYLDRVAESRDPTHVGPEESLCGECFTYHVGECA